MGFVGFIWDDRHHESALSLSPTVCMYCPVNRWLSSFALILPYFLLPPSLASPHAHLFQNTTIQTTYHAYTIPIEKVRYRCCCGGDGPFLYFVSLRPFTLDCPDRRGIIIPHRSKRGGRYVRACMCVLFDHSSLTCPNKQSC